MEPGLMEQGVELLVYGMGTVLTFLSLLVLVTMLMSAVMQRYFVPAPPAPDAAVSREVNDPTLLAVISAAIHQHRSRH